MKGVNMYYLYDTKTKVNRGWATTKKKLNFY